MSTENECRVGRNVKKCTREVCSGHLVTGCSTGTIQTCNTTKINVSIYEYVPLANTE